MNGPWDNDPEVTGPWDNDPEVRGPWDNDVATATIPAPDANGLVSGETYGPITPEERQRRIDAWNAGVNPDETGIWATIKNIPSDLKDFTGSAMGSLFTAASGGKFEEAIGYDAEAEGQPYLEKLAQDRQRNFNRIQQTAGDSEVARAIGNSSAAMGEMIPALVGGAAVKGIVGIPQATQAVLGIMAGTYGPGYYNEARQKNKTVLESLGYTAAMTGAEIGASVAGMKVAKKLGGTTLAGIFGSGRVKSAAGALAGIASQGGEEVLTQYVQNVIGTVSGVNPEAWENLGRQTWDNFAVGSLLGASANVPGLLGEKVEEFLANPSRSNARKLGLGETSAKEREQIAEAAREFAQPVQEQQATVEPVAAPPAPESTPTPTVESEAAQPEVAPEGPTDALTQRFRGLASHAIDPVARQANFESDAAMGFPDRKKWADAETEAAQRIAADPDGERARLLAEIEAIESTGGTIDLRDMTKTAELAHLRNAAGIEGIVSDSPEARELHRRMNKAFRESRTKQAQSLGYRDPVEKSPRARAQNSLANAILSVDEARFQELRKELSELGIDISKMDELVDDPTKSSLVLQKFRPEGSSRWDMAYEYWRNAILSGPRTHATNIMGNTMFAAWNLGPERAAEAAVNLFIKDPKAAQLGEFGPMLGAFMPAAKRGIENARMAWRTERSALSDELGRESAFKVDGTRHAIPGKLGRLVRAFGFRPLLAVDEFAKTITSAMEASAFAYRTAKQEGLEGNALAKRMQELTEDYSSVAWDAGLQKAEELAFQGQHGLVAQKLAKGVDIARQIPGARWIVPFRDTPAAIFEQGLKRAPVLGAILDYTEARRAGANISDAGMTQTLARQILALGGIMLVWDMIDDEEPWITGAGKYLNPKERALAYRTVPPQSIKIGGRWYSYSRVEPFALSMSATVDAVEGLKHGKPLSAVAKSLIAQTKDKTYLDGLGDVIDAIQQIGNEDVSALGEWAGKFAASWIPNIYRQTVGSMKGEIPERKVWGKDWDRVSRIVNRAGQSAQLPGVESLPRFDVWGRRVRYNDHWYGPATDFLWNILSPVNEKKLDNAQKMDLALMRYRQKHPSSSLNWQEPAPYFEHRGETIYLTDEEYAEYAEATGKAALAMASRITVDVKNPTEAQIAAIKNAVTIARRNTRTRLKPTWLKSRQ